MLLHYNHGEEDELRFQIEKSGGKTVGRDSSRLAGICSLAMMDDLKMEPLNFCRGFRQNEAQQNRSTPGERRMKTQGSMMELMEMKRRAFRSSRWDSSRFFVMELM
ncbi:hypothetical protein EYF80_033048 [Liparis tanakae]|uniref:Uncharacterized protein n=1 Tax=Liparis tanakae TaxID=230148 RepID=A0A4Z2GVD7_9TELE|nr:hypothetical protein EYF80_033048 [Liparis tanakae]